MKPTGIIRRIDDLGRIVIPKEIRRTMGIHENDPMEIFLHEGFVVFKKYNPYTQYEDMLANLKQDIMAENGMVNKLDILQRINEIAELLRAEANREQG